MAVRIKLSLKTLLASSAASIDAVAWINSGYEAGRSELIVPARLAQRLGWWPSPPGAITQSYGSAGGAFEVHRLPAALEVAAVAPHRFGPSAVADAVIAPAETEVLVSDALVGPFGIVLLDASQGLWTFRDELTGALASEPRQSW
jgi:hypothetical protein